MRFLLDIGSYNNRFAFPNQQKFPDRLPPSDWLSAFSDFLLYQYSCAIDRQFLFFMNPIRILGSSSLTQAWSFCFLSTASGVSFNPLLTCSRIPSFFFVCHIHVCPIILQQGELDILAPHQPLLLIITGQYAFFALVGYCSHSMVPYWFRIFFFIVTRIQVASVQCS